MFSANIYCKHFTLLYKLLPALWWQSVIQQFSGHHKPSDASTETEFGSAVSVHQFPWQWDCPWLNTIPIHVPWLLTCGLTIHPIKTHIKNCIWKMKYMYSYCTSIAVMHRALLHLNLIGSLSKILVKSGRSYCKSFKLWSFWFAAHVI